MGRGGVLGRKLEMLGWKQASSYPQVFPGHTLCSEGAADSMDCGVIAKRVGAPHTSLNRWLWSPSRPYSLYICLPVCKMDG